MVAADQGIGLVTARRNRGDFTWKIYMIEHEVTDQVTGIGEKRVAMIKGGQQAIKGRNAASVRPSVQRHTP